MKKTSLQAPFPYFGGKSRAASLVWERFGDVPNYVEPFFGSGAVLLGRPHEPRTETVNDLDCHLANFWRALQADPEGVAHYCDWPVSEADLHPRHVWLVKRKPELAEAVMGNPDYYDVKAAGWWVWGLCSWIGSSWCAGDGLWWIEEGKLVNLKKGDSGQGIHRKRPHLGNAGRGIPRNLPHLGDAGQGIQDYLCSLRDRLRRVRVCCGDWSRVLGPSVTCKHGVTGVFLDPPYADTADRDPRLYTEDSLSVAHAVREWALANGDNPKLRIALCGYEGEHDIPETWACVPWKAAGGYGSQGDGEQTPRADLVFAALFTGGYTLASTAVYSGGFAIAKININLEGLPKIMAPVYHPLRNCDTRFIVLMGGRGSGKSYYACQHMLRKVVSLPKRKVAVFRKIADSCRNSVFVRFQSEIARWGLTPLFKINHSSMEMTYRPNGNKIIFLGMKDEKDRLKLKSIDGITDAWAEEASEFLEMDIWDIDFIVRGIVDTQAPNDASTCSVESGDLPWHEMQFLLTFNPFYGSWLKAAYFDDAGDPRDDIDDVHVMVTTIDDNPWASDKDKQRLDVLKGKDKELYERYRHAKWTRLTGLIYDPPIMETDYPERFDYKLGGIDWGFNDPLVFLEIGIKDQEPYITEKIYQTGLTTNDLIDMVDGEGRLVRQGLLTDLGVPKLFEDGGPIDIQGVDNTQRPVNPEAYLIYCYGAEPDRILTLQRGGWWAVAAPKGPGSIKAGIDFCKGLKIHSCAGNLNLNREFECYKWKSDTGGKSIDVPLDENDHTMDAMRYPLWAHIGKPQQIVNESIVTIDTVQEYGQDILPDIY
jgi:phage terminase large subunit